MLPSYQMAASPQSKLQKPAFKEGQRKVQSAHITTETQLVCTNHLRNHFHVEKADLSDHIDTHGKVAILPMYLPDGVQYLELGLLNRILTNDLQKAKLSRYIQRALYCCVLPCNDYSIEHCSTPGTKIPAW